MTLSQQIPMSFAEVKRKAASSDVHGEYVTMFDETFYCIRNYDALDPFFMTLVSGSDHWLFISTTGGLSAGRVNSDHALFPYYTVDKITMNSEYTGTKSMFRVVTEASRLLWEPFSDYYRGIYQVERNIYKNISSSVIVFEEINHDLHLTYRYAWQTSDIYGFVKTAWLINDNETAVTIEVLDGLQNIMPAHVTADVQNAYSNLLDAYKFSEIHAATGLGIFALSSRLTDLAEPSESLRANTVWHTGLDNVIYLISSDQLARFRAGDALTEETLVRGKRGAYFIHSTITLEAKDECTWHIVGEVNQDSASTHALVQLLSEKHALLGDLLKEDIKISQRQLEARVAYADGFQVSQDNLSTAHHFANVLFNIMRGGVFANQYHIDREDLKDYIAINRPQLLSTQSDFFAALPEYLPLSELREAVDKTDSPDLKRLVHSYLSLTFSRRHGDPSRPWNRFEINVKKPGGRQRLDYQGNWRDIFQNWEALGFSYPQFFNSMIHVFLNATTFDGYNPYRITRNGIDWEVPEPDSSWANIGYWNDHQIIYLLKLLEAAQSFYPDGLVKLLASSIFSYANVPYRIKPYDALLKNAYDSIEFDWESEEKSHARVQAMGADGKLVQRHDGTVLHVSMIEKLLSLLLAKFVNFVPEGGIWLNTQRPEWNDANNALVGKGLSVVTLGYLRRYVVFLTGLLASTDEKSFAISSELATLFGAIHRILDEHKSILDTAIRDTHRRTMMDQLGRAGSAFRWQFYEHGVSDAKTNLSVDAMQAFLQLAQAYIDHSLQANKRDDHLYHAYNVLHLSENSARIDHLYEMLEGQVAILSSGVLRADEAVLLLQAMRQSKLYRADQHTYMLYPNRDLPGFLEKNVISAMEVENSQLVAAVVNHHDPRLILKGINGHYHFNGDIRNAKDLRHVLDNLAQESVYSELVNAEREQILDLFEQKFDHAEFTGRSGTFFAFEGLGSIYWHMVSKLLLAVQETILWAQAENSDQATVDALIGHYFDVRDGLGFNKSPEVYGAFPTDPYSHTPEKRGAKQPGMTGMVKEEILTRLVECGIVIEAGEIVFLPILLRQDELLTSESILEYLNTHGEAKRLNVPVGALAFTLCQVPFIVQKAATNQLTVYFDDEHEDHIAGHRLPAAISQQVFARSGDIRSITIHYIGTA